jgi:hypothetical protein
VEGLRVRLEQFVVTEWLPLSPGRFFTPAAQLHRDRARHYQSLSHDEYLPLGKEYMILGGVGSVRLANKALADGRYAVMGASKEGISHEGIPIFVREEHAVEIKKQVAEDGSRICDIAGTIRYIPKQLSIFQYDKHLSRAAVFVEDLTIRSTPIRDPIVTVAIAYSNGSPDFLSSLGNTSIQKAWCFASFAPNPDALYQAIDWMKDYALRHTWKVDPILLFDFDETQEHFPNQVEFTLRDLFGSRFDNDLLRHYAQTISGPGMTINISGDVVMGDKFENITGSSIVNRSQIAEASRSPQIWRLALLVEKSGSDELAVSFNDLLEALKAESVPLSRWWEIRNSLKEHFHEIDDLAPKVWASPLNRLGTGMHLFCDKFYELGEIDSPAFRDFLSEVQSLDIPARILAWHKLCASYGELRDSEPLTQEILNTYSLKKLSAAKLSQLGAAAYLSNKKGAVILFTSILKSQFVIESQNPSLRASRT